MKYDKLILNRTIKSFPVKLLIKMPVQYHIIVRFLFRPNKFFKGKIETASYEFRFGIMIGYHKLCS